MWDSGARTRTRPSIGNRLHGARSRSRFRAGAGRGGSERGGDPAIDRSCGFKRSRRGDCRRGPEIGSRGYFSGGCKRPDRGDCRRGPASCGKLRPPGGGRAAHGGRSTNHRGRVHQVPPCASGRYRAVAGPRASSSPGFRSQGHERRGDPKDGGSSGYRGNGRRCNTR